ncbi:hypothetical protein MMC13_007988 [Lambiella insularis]|nr:hypothetical protein [Lambiella insularis]
MLFQSLGLPPSSTMELESDLGGRTQTVYNSLGLRKNVVSVTKTSAIESNLYNMTQFIDGDKQLVKLHISPNNIWSASEERLSAYHNAKLNYVFESDIYGNQVSATYPTGLVETNTYDNNFHLFAIQVTQSRNGLAQPLIRSYAFDARFGAQAANTQYSSLVTYYTFDAFGRENVSMITASPSPPSQNTDQIVAGDAQLSSKPEELGKQTTFEYDAAGNMILATDPDSNGKATGMSSAEEVFTVNYNASGKMTSQTYNGQSFAFQYDGFGKTSIEFSTSYADNSIKVRVSPDFTITTQSDGIQVTERFFYGPDCILAKVTDTNTQQTTYSLGVFFTNHKGNISHIFSASGQLQRQLTDPLTNCDITNRYAFENNGPINHVDPTGHWTSWTFATLIVGVIVTAVAAAVITVMTFGLAGPIAGSGFGKGIASDTAAGFAIGLITGGIGGTIPTVRVAQVALECSLARAGALTFEEYAGGRLVNWGVKALMAAASSSNQHFATAQR